MATISTCAVGASSPLARFLHSPIRLKPPDSSFLRPPAASHRTLPLYYPNLAGRRLPSGWLPVRASSGAVDVGLAVRPGAVIETDKLPADVRNRTMEAVDALGGRVTIGDVASKAGLKLPEAQRALQALAADADGFLEVSDEGDVLYVFRKDYRAKLAAKSFRLKVEPLVEKAKGALEYGIRVSFATTLVASIVIVYTAIIVILTSSKRDSLTIRTSVDSDDDGRRRRGRSFDSGFNFYFSPTDLYWLWDRNSYGRRQREREDSGEKMNFIESVFSFVFGDGDPNQGIEEKRWKLIGQYITSNGGVVAAEELAPYLDVQSSSEDMSDESYMLPVLLRFDGNPQIDEEGNILYRFPSLQRTASNGSRAKEYVGIGRRWTDWVGKVDSFFKEKQWQFSKTSATERAMVAGLGGLNLFGVVILGTMLKESAITQSGFLSFVTVVFPLLQIYAGSFFAIPAIRWLIVQKTNAGIKSRNQAREKFAKALELPDLSLRRKLLSSRDMAQNTVIGQDRIVYSTDRDLIEQDYEAKDWDRRFRELNKTD